MDDHVLVPQAICSSLGGAEQVVSPRGRHARPRHRRRAALWLGRALLAGCAAWLALRAWATLRPTAFPYLCRRLLDVPRPLITRRDLLEILDPAAGERILEVGPGTGYYTLPVASRLEPGGILEILDVRQGFIDHTLERARRRSLVNVVPTVGHGDSLPYSDGSFDAAYLVGVLGEIPKPEAALRELRRVLKPGGRLVIGEIFIDPDSPRCDGSSSGPVLPDSFWSAAWAPRSATSPSSANNRA
ncbi:MAG TPA: methyltransferase domain-containing protein [Thermoleophilia bacterium]|nr:methyltransferase domain-containing protein [Thermoleophilia bacterium]